MYPSTFPQSLWFYVYHSSLISSLLPYAPFFFPPSSSKPTPIRTLLDSARLRRLWVPWVSPYDNFIVCFLDNYHDIYRILLFQHQSASFPQPPSRFIYPRVSFLCILCLGERSSGKNHRWVLPSFPWGFVLVPILLFSGFCTISLIFPLSLRCDDLSWPYCILTHPPLFLFSRSLPQFPFH